MATVVQKKKLMTATTAGVTLQAASPAFANNQASCGWDFVIVDTINAALGQRDIFNILTAVGDVSKTCSPIIKVGGPADRTGIQQATDTGAAGVLVPHITTAAEAVMARSTTLYPSAPSPVHGTRSFIGPVRAHNKLGFIPGWLTADVSIFCALQLEEAPQSEWAAILETDFHVAVLDVPKLCCLLGLYDGLFASPPQDPELPVRLGKFHAVYATPTGALLQALTKFVALCKAAKKTPGVLLGEPECGLAYSKLGFKFLGVGSELGVLFRMGDAALKKQADNPTHSWKLKPLSTVADKARAASLASALAGPATGAVLTGGTYAAAAAARAGRVVFLDGILASPTELERMLRLCDGDGARLVRVRSASEADAPSTAEHALALGADAVVAPVASAAEAKALRAACDWKARRSFNIGPELVHQLEKKVLAGAELLTMPAAAELAAIAAVADFVMCSEAAWQGNAAALAAAEKAVKAAGKPFVLLADGDTPTGVGAGGLVIKPAGAPPAAATDPKIVALNAATEAFKVAQQKGEPRIGLFSFCTSPAAVAAMIDMGHDWIMIEWQHSPMDLPTLVSMVAAIHQRGGIAMTRVGGYHDALGIAQAAEAGIDVCLIPYINNPAEAAEGIKHVLPPPAGDRPASGGAFAKAKKMAIMFQYETSECIDNLAANSAPEALDYCFVGPGDLALSMGLHTRDTGLMMMKASEMQWCYHEIVQKAKAAGKIPGGFTRGGDPSMLLKHGFRTVCVGADIFHLMMGAESIQTGACTIPMPMKTEPGISLVKGRSKEYSRLVASPVFLFTEMVPTVLKHVASVKTGKPRLNLPKQMPASFAGVTDMEAEEKK